ncbi:UNVERIFIED_CONTAM: hypothetical protein Slati_2486900 [Sesamum latifolium]|uniref:GAG-pre-integrase domain-containing protein n=1 Tax=Sesamum latifolium TaxID=2727402 RepID=A0AAW2WG49_9LAMI
MIRLESSGSCEKARQNILESHGMRMGYVLEKPLPTALPEGSSPEERLTFEKWHDENRKICRDKSILRDQDGRGIVCAESRGQDAFLVEKFEDLKDGLNNDTYIDVILQSLLPSYDPFIVNYNMNRLEKSIHELINMLVQYEATTHNLMPEVLVGEASTSKAKGKGARCWNRKKGKETAVTATASTGGKGHWKRSVHNSSPTQVLERSRKLSKDEMILRLGDGKTIAAEAMGSLSLVSNLIMTAQHKRKLDSHENAQIWHARLGHISKDRIRRLVDSKNLEIDNLDHLPTCESYLKGKMTKKPFVGQSASANGLLDFVHTDVCGPLSIPAGGGFSYFITFTDDHSRYGYVYLMRYKSEAFGRFKEYRLEVENQTNRKIKPFGRTEVVST